MSPGPDAFARRFAAAYGARDGDLIAALCTEDASALTLTGAWAEGRPEIAACWAGDLAGQLAGTRLVTGKGRLIQIGTGAVLLHQRFVLSGLPDATGEAGRIAVMLSALLVTTEEDWLAQSLILAPLV